MNPANKSARYILILIALSYFFFMFGNGIMSLTNPDEVFYAQIAKEMAQHASWLTPYLFDAPNFEKPIFLYWLLRCGFILFGVSSFAARFFPAVFGVLGAIAAYFLGLLGFKDSRKAFFSALVLISSVFYIGMARTVFTDMVFSVWILLALLFFIWGYLRRQRKRLSLILFFACSAFAVLTKGPLGLIIPLLIVVLFLYFNREVKYLRCGYAIGGILIFLVIALPWYMCMFTKYGNAFIREFFYNDHIRRLIEAEHKAHDTWYFYPFSIGGCMFPWSLFVPVSLWALAKRRLCQREPFYLFLACWIAAVFIIFQVAHSKLASYILPMFPALALLIGDYVSDIMVRKKITSATALFASTWCVLMLFLVALLVGAVIYPEYVPVKTPLYFFVSFVFCLLLIMLRFILRPEFFKVFVLLVFFGFALLLLVPFVKNDVEPNIASIATGEYLLNKTRADSTLLCAKPFVRGVRYYTGRKVAVMGSNFFSPHPIPFLDSDEKVKDFLRSQSATYCVFSKSLIQDIERIAKQEFNVAVLKKIGNEYIVKIEPVRKMD